MRLNFSAVEAPKVTQNSISNLNDGSAVTELQVTACVFGSNYAFHLIAEGLLVCRFSGAFLYDVPFCSYKALKSPTPYFRTRSDMLHRWTCPVRMRSNLTYIVS